MNELTNIMKKAQENITKGITEINSDHAAIHQGYGYAFNIFESALAAEGVAEYSYKAPATEYAHIKNLVVQVKGGNCKVELLKGVTVTVDTGTAVPLTQQNDNSTNTASSAIKASPTYSGGTAIKTAIVLADATNQSIGSASFSLNDNQEVVTKTDDEYYVIKITNLDVAGAIDVVIDGFLYEEHQGLVS